MVYSSVMLRLWSSNKKCLDLLYSCLFGPCQKNCIEETAKQAIKKAACTEETNVVQQLGKMHEVYQLEI